VGRRRQQKRKRLLKRNHRQKRSRKRENASKKLFAIPLPKSSLRDKKNEKGLCLSRPKSTKVVDVRDGIIFLIFSLRKLGRIERDIVFSLKNLLVLVV